VRRRVLTIAGGVVGALACALLPLVVTARSSLGKAPYVASTYGIAFQPWELFAAPVAAGLLVVFAIELSRRGAGPWIARPLIGAAVALHFLWVLSEFAEFSVGSIGWSIHRSALECVEAGESPYAVLDYVGSPVVVGMMRVFQDVAATCWRVAGARASNVEVFTGMQYLWQCCQFYALMGTFLLLALWGERRQGVGLTGWFLSAGLMVLSFPMLRALRQDPAAPFLLFLSTVVITQAHQRVRDWLTAAAIATSAYVGMYPLLLLLPFAVGRRWGVVWRSAALVGVLVAPWLIGGDGYLWAEGLSRLWRAFVVAPSLEAGLQGTLEHLVFRVGLGHRAEWVIAAADLAIVLAVVHLIWRRLQPVRDDSGGSGATHWDVAVTEAVVLLALVFPTRWGAEYTLALPAGLVALQHWKEKPALVASGIILALLMPGVDEALLRCHRFVGVALLLWALVPSGPHAPAGNSGRTGSSGVTSRGQARGSWG
jgi:hypothetical protein